MLQKTHVAPLEGATIPRLELLGMIVLVRLMANTTHALANLFQVLKTVFWSDSLVNLHRVKGLSNEYKSFKERRLKEIRNKANVDDWHYVPTHENPADLPTRGCNMQVLVKSTMWAEGPDFIHESSLDPGKFDLKLVEQGCSLSENCLVSCSFSGVDQEEGVQGESATDAANAGIYPTCQSGKKKGTNISFSRLSFQRVHEVIDINRFNSFEKLLRVTCFVLRFVRKVSSGHSLTATEMAEAELLWTLSVQQSETIDNSLSFKKTAANLALFQDVNGVVRCNGRLKNSNLDYNIIYPIYIPHDHYFTDLLVKKAHDDVHHQRVNATLVQLRSKYWVPRGRQKVKSVLRNCRLCKFYDSLSFKLPAPPPLPEFRLDTSYSFANTGVDHLGPLFITDVYNRENLYKAYIALFTCATTRAVHLEVQPSLNASHFVNGMKRAFARIGTPRHMLSDNHKCFRSELVQRYASSNCISWHFSLERAPHWGGFWESLVKVVKRALLKTVERSTLSYEQLVTVITQIEAVINSRPLYVSSNDCEFISVTPSHLLYG